MTEAQKEQLDERGFLVLENFMSKEMLEQLRHRIEALFELEGERAGSEFRREEQARRLANLVDKGKVFQRIVSMADILELVAYVLGPQFKLSSLNARSTDPFSTLAQPLHCDMGALPDERGYSVCNCIWMLDDFTGDNGATRAVPGSHRWAKLPQQVMDDARAPHPQQVLVTGKAGTVVVMNAHLWHGGTVNRTAKPRCAVHSFYVRRDLPQQQYQKKWLRQETQDQLSPLLRTILALDDPLNDELSSRDSGRSGFLK